MSKDMTYQFPTTHWSLVERAAAEQASGTAADTAGGQTSALARLLGRYVAPLKAHLVHDWRLPPHDTDDLVNGFVADKVLDAELLSRASREKGRFRTFLLVTLDRYTSNQLRNESRKPDSAKNRRPLREAYDLPSEDPTPSGVFEIAWARQVLANAAGRMKEHCEANGRLDIWAVFNARVLSPTLEGAEPVPYEQLVTQMSLPDGDAASNLLVTAKRMFARSLRGVVGEYMGEGGEVEQEIEDLRAILARASR